MKILVLMDSFKGSLTSIEAGEAVKTEILSTFSELHFAKPFFHLIGTFRHILRIIVGKVMGMPMYPYILLPMAVKELWMHFSKPIKAAER